MVSEKPFGDDDPQKETAEIRLEDKETGDLFASAPYDSPQVYSNAHRVGSGAETVLY